MVYLQDNKYRKYKNGNSSKYLGYILFVLFLLIIIVLLKNFFKKFSYTVAVPIVESKQILERALVTNLSSKTKLLEEVEYLKSQNQELYTKLLDYEIIENENATFKNLQDLGELEILAFVVARPSETFYDTLLVRTSKPVLENKNVYTISGVPIGFVSSTNGNNAVVTLYSSSGLEKNAELINNNDFTNNPVILYGRGGGGFEAILPQEINISIGSYAVLLGGNQKPFAEVVKTIVEEDTKDKIVYLRSVVNFQHTRYVMIES